MPKLRYQGEEEYPGKYSREEWPVRWNQTKQCPGGEVKRSVKKRSTMSRGADGFHEGRNEN